MACAQPAALSVPSTAVPDPKGEALATLQAEARRLEFETRLTAAGVLQVMLPDTVCFTNLNQWHEVVKATSKRTGVAIEDLIGSVGTEFVMATRIGRKRERPADPPSDRALEDVLDKVDVALKGVRKAAPKDSLNDSEVDVARAVLEKAIGGLCGPGGDAERSVQSFGVFQKKLAPSDPRPRLVLALRLNAGIPIKISALKHALGGCWADGALTVGESVSGVDSVQLPLTEEGRASRDFGNLPVLVVTSVPVQSG